MSILFADNFKNYGNSTARMLDGIWAEIAGITGDTQLLEDPDPNETGYVLSQFGSNSSRRARMVYPGGGKTVAGFSVRFWVSSLPPSLSSWGQPRILFEDNVGTDITGIAFLPDGGIGVTNNVTSSPPTFLAFTGPVITANAWNHIEGKLTTGGAGAGAIEIRINGITVLNETGLTWSASTPVSSFVLYQTGTASTAGTRGYWKDLILWDTAGTVNNDFIGTANIYTLRPTSDVSLNWTPSTGTTGWDLIDENDPVSDADFISAADPPPSPAVFDVTDLPPDIVTVKALLPFVRTRKIDGGDGNVQLGLTGTLTDLGTDRPITTAFTSYWDVSELSPDTGVSWTPTEVNNVNLEINRTI